MTILRFGGRWAAISRARRSKECWSSPSKPRVPSGTPISFKTARSAARQSCTPLDLIVLEASSIVEIDFTAAQILIEFVEFCTQSKIRFAVARLESVRAGEAFECLGITDAVHRDHFFHSVDEAIMVLAKKTK